MIPDCQVKSGVPLDHLAALSNYIVHKKPDVIVQIGDFADMPSLSSYDQGKRAGEGTRYESDIKSSRSAMGVLNHAIEEYNNKARRLKFRQYRPRKVLTLGNHENRISKHVNNYPILEGKLSYNDLGYGEFGWEVYDFLRPVEINGILYAHYFPRNAQGRIVQAYRGSPSAALQVRREMQSASAGHLQGLDFAIHQTGSRRYYGLIAGSFYMHDDDYLTPQGTAYWRGVVYKNEVHDGEYDPMFVSLNYLLSRWL